MISLHRRSASGEFYRGRLQAMKADFKQINVRQSKSRSRSPQGEIDETEVNEIIPLDQA